MFNIDFSFKIKWQQEMVIIFVDVMDRAIRMVFWSEE